jgi:hypothetical protein
MPNQLATRAAVAFRRKARASLVCMLLPAVAALAEENGGASGTALCAQREVLLHTLVEAHGQVANPPAAMLAEANIAISQARAACTDGRAEAAVAIYDRLIATFVPLTGERETAGAGSPGR